MNIAFIVLLFCTISAFTVALLIQIFKYFIILSCIFALFHI